MSTHGSLSEVELFNLLYISRHKYDEKIPKMILYNGNSVNWLSESQTWKAVTPAIFSHRKSNLS